MALSDDEDETLPSSVENYYFEDGKEEPVSFSVLPVQWSVSDGSGDNNAEIFLRADADKGLIKIYRQVVAWRFDLSNVKPEISVLSKEKHWIKLDKPRKSYEEMIRSILVTVNFLHFVVRNPEPSGKPLWDSLSKDYGSFEVRPSEKDLVDHISLISEAVKRDNALSKSKFLAEFLKEKPGKRRLPAEEPKAKRMTHFIVSDSDDDMIDGEEGDESDEDDEMFDSVCSFCDNGGNLLCCEGSCLRSFHPSVEVDTECKSLGLTKEEVQATLQFLCKNCEYKQHQCFACGKLGSSDKYSGAEVIQCVSATCGNFFHPRCVAKLIHEDNKCSAEELEKKIKAGESFTCPAHKCCVCKQGENKQDRQLQLAVCRRCPKSYHRKCLPKKIAFEDDHESDAETRAWDGLLPNRILLYCLKHNIDEKLGTPIRDHIKFPGVEEKKSTAVKTKTTIEEKRPKQTSVLLGDKKKIERKAETPRQERKASEFKQPKKPSSALKVEVHENPRKLGSVPSSSRKLKVNGSVKMEPESARAEKKQSLGCRLFELVNKDSQPADENTSDDDIYKAVTVPLDADSEKRYLTIELQLLGENHDLDAHFSPAVSRVLDIMKNSESSISIESVKEKLHSPSTDCRNTHKHFEERTITMGKVETSIEAVRAAFETLEKNRDHIEDAKAVCGPDLLLQIHKWKHKLRVYLGPFLHGMRYTSFGRHFTKPEKLQEIADKLQWYAEDGDMVVDFCCGSNDFSIFMKTKLEARGKKCLYKNYDLMPTANDFNFEKKDWEEVQPKDLPNGSKLIMGLNPPFGIRGAKANTFIDRAIKFKPKLLILIAPEETERLNDKKTPYDLVWEDTEMLAGKSFYLPGSTDVKDKLLDQWNSKPPLLCLWSRPDMTVAHRAIALKQGHISNQQKNIDRGLVSPDHRIGTHDHDHSHDHDHEHDPVHDFPVDGNNDTNMNEDDIHGAGLVPTDNPVQTVYMEGYEPKGLHKESSPLTNGDGASNGSHGHGKNLFNEGSRKRGRNNRSWKKNKRRDSGRISAEHNHNGGRAPVREPAYSPRMSPRTRNLGENINHHNRGEPYVPGSPSRIAGRRYTGVDNDNGTSYPHRSYVLSTGPAMTQVYGGEVGSFAVRQQIGRDAGVGDDGGTYHQSSYGMSAGPALAVDYGAGEMGSFATRQQIERDAIHLRTSVRSQALHYGHQDLNSQGNHYLSDQDQNGYPPDHGRQLAPLAYTNVGTPLVTSPSGAIWSDHVHRASLSAFNPKPQTQGYFDGRTSGFDVGPSYMGHPVRPPPPPPPPMAYAPPGAHHYKHHGSGGWFDHPRD